MPAVSTKRVRVHYRRFYRGAEPAIDRSLSDCLSRSLKHSVDGICIDDEVKLRTFIDKDQGSILLNGRFVSKSGDVYGELVHFHPDTNIPLLMQNSESSAELEIRELDKPNNAEVLRGINYFMIRGDHVLSIEQSLTNVSCERYFKWLLCEQTAIAVRNQRIQLIPQALLDDSAELLKEVGSIKLHPSPVQANEFYFSEQTELNSKKTTDTGTNILGILRAAAFDTSVIERISAENNASIEINLSLTLRVGRTPLKLKGEEAVALLRNVPEEDLTLRGDGIQKKRGVFERLSLLFDVERKGNLLDRKGAWSALREAATKYRDAGLIE